MGECDEKIDPGLMNRREIQEIDQINQLNFWQGCKHNREILVFLTVGDQTIKIHMQKLNPELSLDTKLIKNGL